MAEQLAVPAKLARRLTDGRETVWLRIGDLRFLMMDLAGALVAYKFALECNPTNVHPLTQAGATLARREHYADAVDFLEQAVKASPSCGEAWAFLAHCYVMTDYLGKAYNAYQSALNHLPNPRDPNLWYGIGLLYDRYGSLENALEAFLAVLNIAPDFERAEEVCFCIGIIYKEQAKYDESLEYFNKAVVADALQPPLTRADAWYQIGHVHELKSDLAAAVEKYHRALRENPNHAKSLQQLGWLTHQQGNSAEAIQLLDRSTQAEPKEGQSWYLLGRVYMANREFRRAYDAYQQAVYRDGNNATFWCSIGVLYYNMQQHRDAMDAYSRAIRLNPKISEVWFDLGTLYESCHQLRDATDAYRQAAELAPDNQEIAQRLSILQQSLQTGVPPPPASAMAIADGPPVAPSSSATQGQSAPGPLFSGNGAFPAFPMPANPGVLRRPSAPGGGAPGGGTSMAMRKSTGPTPSLRPVPGYMPGLSSAAPAQSANGFRTHQAPSSQHLSNHQARHSQAPPPLTQQPVQQLQPLLPQRSQDQQMVSMDRYQSRSQPDVSVDRRPMQSVSASAGPGSRQANNPSLAGTELHSRQHEGYSGSGQSQGLVSQQLPGPQGYSHLGPGQAIPGHNGSVQQLGHQSPPIYPPNQQQGRPSISHPQHSTHGPPMPRQDINSPHGNRQLGPHDNSGSAPMQNAGISRGSDVSSQSNKLNVTHGTTFQTQGGTHEMKPNMDSMSGSVPMGPSPPSGASLGSIVHSQRQYLQPPISQHVPTPHVQGSRPSHTPPQQHATAQPLRGAPVSGPVSIPHVTAQQYVPMHDSVRHPISLYNHPHAQDNGNGSSIPAPGNQQGSLPSSGQMRADGPADSRNAQMVKPTRRDAPPNPPNSSMPPQLLPRASAPQHEATHRESHGYRSEAYPVQSDHPGAGKSAPQSQSPGRTGANGDGTQNRFTVGASSGALPSLSNPLPSVSVPQMSGRFEMGRQDNTFLPPINNISKANTPQTLYATGSGQTEQMRVSALEEAAKSLDGSDKGDVPRGNNQPQVEERSTSSISALVQPSGANVPGVGQAPNSSVGSHGVGQRNGNTMGGIVHVSNAGLMPPIGVVGGAISHGEKMGSREHRSEENGRGLGGSTENLTRTQPQSQVQHSSAHGLVDRGSAVDKAEGRGGVQSPTANAGQTTGEQRPSVDEAMLPTLTPLREKGTVVSAEKDVSDLNKATAGRRDQVQLPRPLLGQRGESAQTESESGSGAITPALPSPDAEPMEVTRANDVTPRGKVGNVSRLFSVGGKGRVDREEVMISSSDKTHGNVPPKPGPLPSFKSSLHGRRSSTPDGADRMEESKGTLGSEFKAKSVVAASLMTLSRPVGDVNYQRVDISNFSNSVQGLPGNNDGASRSGDVDGVAGSIGKGGNANGHAPKSGDVNDGDRESVFRKGDMKTVLKSTGESVREEDDKQGEAESRTRSPRGLKRPRSEDVSADAAGGYRDDAGGKNQVGIASSGNNGGVPTGGLASMPPLRSVPIFASGGKTGNMGVGSARSNGVRRDHSAPASPAMSRSSSERRRSDNREYRGRERSRHNNARHGEDRHRERRREWSSRRGDRDRESGRNWDRDGEKDRDWDREREYRERDSNRGSYFSGGRR